MKVKKSATSSKFGKMSHRMSFILFLVLAGLALPAQSEMLRSAHSQARLVSEFSEIAPGRPFNLGLLIKTEPGWHTYWRNAGDSGAAPILKWSHSDDLKLGETRWPFPERIRVGPLVNYGYDGETLLIVPAVLSGSAQGTRRVELKAEWLVC